VIEYLKEFLINYVIIFDANPANRLNPSSMYILSSILMILWTFCMIGQTMTLKDYIPLGTYTFAYIML